VRVERARFYDAGGAGLDDLRGFDSAGGGAAQSFGAAFGRASRTPRRFRGSSPRSPETMASTCARAAFNSADTRSRSARAAPTPARAPASASSLPPRPGEAPGTRSPARGLGRETVEVRAQRVALVAGHGDLVERPRGFSGRPRRLSARRTLSDSSCSSRARSSAACSISFARAVISCWSAAACSASWWLQSRERGDRAALRRSPPAARRAPAPVGSRPRTLRAGGSLPPTPAQLVLQSVDPPPLVVEFALQVSGWPASPDSAVAGDPRARAPVDPVRRAGRRARRAAPRASSSARRVRSRSASAPSRRCAAPSSRGGPVPWRLLRWADSLPGSKRLTTSGVRKAKTSSSSRRRISFTTATSFAP